MDNKIGVYVHIPFCQSKCLYCDFTSFANASQHMASYKDALLCEIKTSKALLDKEIQTIFIGGGTPTALPPLFLQEIIDILMTKNIASDAEITVEANPGTLTPDMLIMLKKAGVNRLSMGLQAVQDPLLQKIGRIHSYDEFLTQYKQAVSLGFDNINVDIMFGLPGQSLDDWRQTLETIVHLAPQHISAYGLLVEEDTAFGIMHRAGTLQTVSDEDDRAMFALTQNILLQNGYAHYEISNFAKQGYECRHNIMYWQRGEYIGFGLNAHSFLDHKRFYNIDDLARYLQTDFAITDALSGCETITTQAAMEEFMFLGLRMVHGINTNEFFDTFHLRIESVYGAVIQRFLAQELLQQCNGQLFLTKKGIDISNYVLSAFLL